MGVLWWSHNGSCSSSYCGFTFWVKITQNSNTCKEKRLRTNNVNKTVWQASKIISAFQGTSIFIPFGGQCFSGDVLNVSMYMYIFSILLFIYALWMGTTHTHTLVARVNECAQQLLLIDRSLLAITIVPTCATASHWPVRYAVVFVAVVVVVIAVVVVEAHDIMEAPVAAAVYASDKHRQYMAAGTGGTL